MICIALKYEEDAKKKWPKRLLPSRTQPVNKIFIKNAIEDNSIYILDIYRSKSTVYFYLFIAVVGVLALVMISVWPLWLQLLVWWISFILLCIIV